LVLFFAGNSVFLFYFLRLVGVLNPAPEHTPNFI